MKPLHHHTIVLTCVFVLLFTSLTKAQSTFVRLYNKGNMGYCVREVNGNSYVVAGGTDYYFNWHWFIQSSLLNTNIHLFKTDANGVLQWERIIGKPNTRMVARWMEPTADGGFILTGSTNQDMVWPPDSNDVFLVKTDATGMVNWSKTYDSGKDDLGFCVQQTSDGGYILSGFHDALPVSLAVNTYLLVIKTDNAGNVQWEKKYQFAVRDFNTHEPFAYIIKQTNDGGYVLTGTNAIAHPADAEVLRLDAAGNILWAKTYEHDMSAFRNSVGLDVVETTTGDFVIAGSMDKSSPLEINYPYYLRLSSNGAVLKQRFFETVPLLNFQSGFSSVQQTTDGGFFFTGMGGYSDFGDQAQLLRTNTNLNMNWSRVYTMDGLATVGSMCGRETSDGGYVFTGKRQMSGTILMKTNNVGMVPCKLPNTLIEYTPSVTVSNWSPSVISGINTTSVLLTVSSPMADTVVVCPVTVPTLPVELLYLKAEAFGGEVLLNWSTASEVDCDHYVIERSKDNLNFIEAGIVSGKGNSSSVSNYSFTDASPLPSQSFYRIRQIDFNGTEHISTSVPVSLATKRIEILSIHVEATSGQLVAYIYSPGNFSEEYTITGLAGNKITKGTTQLLKGVNECRLEMKHVSKGMYFLTVGSAENLISRLIYYQ